MNTPQFLFAILLSACGLACSANAGSPLGIVPKPTSKVYPDHRIYGSYAGGCIKKSVALPDFSQFQIIRPSRDRYHAHPTAFDFLQWMSDEMSRSDLGVLMIGDVARDKGGPIPCCHASHQIGLDIDILLWRHPIAQKRPLTEAEREAMKPRSVLTADGKKIDPKEWQPEHLEILKLATEHLRVERIFINSVIKKELCAMTGGAAWLRKLRPWAGHDAHFHVRLACPAGSPDCVHQAPVPEGSGCDVFASGSQELLEIEQTQDELHGQSALPKQCKDILN